MNAFRRIKRAPKLAIIALILSVVASSTIAFALYEMRVDAIDNAKRDSDILASILAEDVSDVSEALDISLRNIVKTVEQATGDNFTSLASGPDIRASLEIQQRDVTQIEFLGISDSEGNVVSGTLRSPAPHIDISDREYFRVLRENPTKGLFVSRPLNNKFNGEWTIFFARRIESPDGDFLGVAFLAVSPSSLVRSHPNITSAGERSFSLVGADGMVALRQPAAGDMVGKFMPPDSFWYPAVASGGGVFYSPGVFDGLPKYVAIKPVAEYPFVVSVAVTKAFALASWRQRATAIILAAVLCAAVAAASLLAQMRLAKGLAGSRFRSRLRAARLSRKSRELESISKRLGFTLDNMSQGMAIIDKDERLLIANRSYAEIYGLRQDQLHIGMTLRDIFALRVAAGSSVKSSIDEYMQFVINHDVGDHLHYLMNGRVVQIRARRTEEGGYFTLHEDVTERVRNAEELSNIALHDSLTQLPNRQAFRTRLAELFHRANGARLAVLLLDIDGFKDVNDTYGHEIGDEVLSEIARRLGEVSEGIFVARLGGDEFAAIVADEQADGPCVNALAEQMIATIRRPITLEGRRILLGLSVGVKIVDSSAPDFSRVMRRADLALYAAKKEGRNTVRQFDEAMDRRFQERVQLASDLRAAVEDGDLDLHYQPIVQASDQRIVCMEALIRWSHPVRGMISPAVFIPIAEENGLIVAIGEWVMRRACADAAGWRDEIVVAVNVSSLQIERPEFADMVIAALATAQLPPSRLQIEITETILLRRNEVTKRAFARLREFGISFALDDFGTGYASLAYLNTFQLDKLKIDKSFIDEVCTKKESLAIVTAIVALARGMDIDVTAEGVETREQYNMLRALGVSTLQGYYFSKPKPIAEHDVAKRPLSASERAA